MLGIKRDKTGYHLLFSSSPKEEKDTSLPTIRAQVFPRLCKRISSTGCVQGSAVHLFIKLTISCKSQTCLTSSSGPVRNTAPDYLGCSRQQGKHALESGKIQSKRCCKIMESYIISCHYRILAKPSVHSRKSVKSSKASALQVGVLEHCLGEEDS